MRFSNQYFSSLDFAVRIRNKIRRISGLPVIVDPGAIYEADLAEVQALTESAEGRFAQLFYSHDGRVINKWAHYLEAYDHHFLRFCDTPVKMLEIGVASGGSLELWRNFFGAKATIFGIDIDPECANRVDPPNQVRIGSQDDPDFLLRVVEEMGTPDIILDDGSHVSNHQLVSFDTLFPLLRDGGIYVIEDMHTAYWPGLFKGGFQRDNSAIGLAKNIIDDMHGWYHQKPMKTLAKTQIKSVHVYDSMMFLEKSEKQQPVRINVPSAPVNH